jgi:8-hydroxy-5-deazaflavin:NADPH oxidoreductase
MWRREFFSSTIYNMNTAIIGLGNIGSQLARNLTAGEERIIVADRTLAKAEKLATDLGERAMPMPIADAINKADVVIFAIYFDVMKELVASYHNALAGKIVIDPSNPIAPDGKGGFKKTIPANQSSGRLIAALLPEGAEFVKAFGTMSAQSLGAAVNRKPERAALFYATDYPEAGRVVAKLITASGFSPVSVGGADQSIRIEVGGDLHEFGKLGRLVSAKEAESLV